MPYQVSDSVVQAPGSLNAVAFEQIAINGALVSVANPFPVSSGQSARQGYTMTSGTAVGTSLTLNCAQYIVANFYFNQQGTISGGQIVFEITDGTAWYPILGSQLDSAVVNTYYNLASNVAVCYQVTIGAMTQVRARLATAITGSGTLYLGGIMSANANPLTSVVPTQANNTSGGTGGNTLVAASSGGWTPGHIISAASTNLTQIKGSAGQLGWISGGNTNAAERYLKLYDAVSVTVGSTTPVQTIILPGAAAGAGNNQQFWIGAQFLNAIQFAVTAGIADSDATAISVNDCAINWGYK